MKKLLVVLIVLICLLAGSAAFWQWYRQRSQSLMLAPHDAGMVLARQHQLAGAAFPWYQADFWDAMATLSSVAPAPAPDLMDPEQQEALAGAGQGPPALAGLPGDMTAADALPAEVRSGLARWVYELLNWESDTPVAGFLNVETGQYLFLRAGEELEGLRVDEISENRVKLSWKDHPLEVLRIPEAVALPYEAPRPLSPEELASRKQRYYEIWGRRFRETAGTLSGTQDRLPEELSPEQQQQALERYDERFRPIFEARSRDYKYTFKPQMPRFNDDILLDETSFELTPEGE